MQGRLENDLKTKTTIEHVLVNMPDYIREWYLFLLNSNRSASSCYDYIRKVRRLLEYISDKPKEVRANEITQQALESFFIASYTTTDKNGMEIYNTHNYMQSLWSAINNLMEFLTKKEYINHNPFKDIEKPNWTEPQEKERVLLTQRDFNKILSAAKDENNKFCNRNVLVLLLFMTTGMKRITISEINLEDIDTETQTLVVVDRNKRTMTYHLDEIVMNYLNKWLIDREKLKTEHSGNALFLTKNGERMGDDTVYNIVCNSCHKGLGKKYPPSELRSSFCAILYKKTRDIEFVQEAVGHGRTFETRQHIKETNKRRVSAKIISSVLDIK